jgi:hypothetical protein
MWILPLPALLLGHRPGEPRARPISSDRHIPRTHIHRAAQPEKGEAVDMDRFINDENLERFRRLASATTSETERKILLGLLAQEEAKFIELQKARNGRRLS